MPATSRARAPAAIPPEVIARYYVQPMFCTQCAALWSPVRMQVAQSTWAWACRQCHRMDGLIPKDSPRAVERPDHFDALAKAHAAALAEATTAARAAAAMAEVARQNTKIAAIIVGAIAAVGLLWFVASMAVDAVAAHRAAFAAKPAPAAADESASARETPARLHPTQIVITSEGVANEKPDAKSEPVRRLHPGDVYTAGARQPGWVHLDDAPTEAWAPESITERRRLGANEPQQHANASPPRDAPAATPAGAKRISGANQWGCQSREEITDLRRLLIEGDKEAFGERMALDLVAGRCAAFEDGDVVFVRDTAVFAGIVKVRRQGDVEEYWTAIEAVE